MFALFLLTLVVVALDVVLLVLLGNLFGFLPVAAAVLLSAFLGVRLTQHEGTRVLLNAQTSLMQGRVPDEGMTDALLVLVGGVCFVVPGLITSLVGAVLLVPWTRRQVARVIRWTLERRMGAAGWHVRTVGQTPFGDEGVGDIAEPWVAWQNLGREASSSRDSGSVIDTEGVEIQTARLLDRGQTKYPDGNGDGGPN